MYCSTAPVQPTIRLSTSLDLSLSICWFNPKCRPVYITNPTYAINSIKPTTPEKCKALRYPLALKLYTTAKSDYDFTLEANAKPSSMLPIAYNTEKLKYSDPTAANPAAVSTALLIPSGGSYAAAAPDTADVLSFKGFGGGSNESIVCRNVCMGGSGCVGFLCRVRRYREAVNRPMGNAAASAIAMMNSHVDVKAKTTAGGGEYAFVHDDMKCYL